MNYKCTHCGWEGEEPAYFNSCTGTATICPLCGFIVEQLHYTCVPPTEPGYYWQRDNNIKRPVEISEENGELVVRLFGIDDILSLSGFDCEWSERIEPPE